MKRKARIQRGPLTLVTLSILLIAIVTGRIKTLYGEVITPDPTSRPQNAYIPLQFLQQTQIPEPAEIVEPEVIEVPTETPEPWRYADIDLSQAELDMLAAIVYLEAGNQSSEGQQAVAEVVLNRMIADNFPDTLEGVIFDTKYGVQFTTARMIPYTTPTQTQYDAVEAALYGENILDSDVVYFSVAGENDRVWGTIGNHVFCRQYIWG